MLHLSRDPEIRIFRAIHHQLRIWLLRLRVPVAIVITLQGNVREAYMQQHQLWRHRKGAGFVHICFSKSKVARDRGGGQRGAGVWNLLASNLRTSRFFLLIFCEHAGLLRD